jgi:hypothetical protein
VKVKVEDSPTYRSEGTPLMLVVINGRRVAVAVALIVLNPSPEMEAVTVTVVVDVG